MPNPPQQGESEPISELDKILDFPQGTSIETIKDIKDLMVEIIKSQPTWKNTTMIEAEDLIKEIEQL